MVWVRKLALPSRRKTTICADALRAIERAKGVHNTTVMAWVKEVGELLPNAYNPEITPRVGELDELETFVGQKKSGATPRIFNALGNAHQDTKFGAAAIAASDARRVFERSSCDGSRPFSTRYLRLGIGRP